MSNVVLYCENLPTEGMETLISELCPKELDLRFLYPVKNGKKGDLYMVSPSFPPVKV